MGKLFFFTEARYIKYKNHYYNSGALKYGLFKRYLRVFSDVIVVARVQYIHNSNDPRIKSCTPANRVDGINLTVYELPYYHGFSQYVKKLGEFKASLNKVLPFIKEEDRCLLRVPGNVGESAARILRRNNIPYYVEVVGNPIDVFSKGSNTHILRFLFKIILPRSLKITVLNAKGVCYITSLVLPEIYPASNKAFTAIISNVELLNDDFIYNVKTNFTEDSIKIISIGSLDQMYKGPDIMLKAIKLLIKQKIDVELTWIGEGKHKNEMIKLAKDLGIDKHCNFIGFIDDRMTIRELLDNADLFVLPSRAEAQGRVILEAMARGKIVIATDVGGIPEIVPKRFLIPKNDSTSLAEKIIEVKQLPGKHYWQNENLRKSKQYDIKSMTQKRDEFLKKILLD